MKELIFNYGVRWPYRTVMGLSHLLMHPALFMQFRRESGACRKAFSGRKALVLGTGRSLKKVIAEITSVVEADRAKAPVLWAVNNFALSPEFVRLQPQNYVLLDPDFRSRESVEGDERRTALLKALTSITWPMHLWIPFSAATDEMWRGYIRGKPDNVHLTPFPARTYETRVPFAYAAYSCCGFAPNYQNVVTLSAFLALYYGASEVGLAGADHNWHQDMIVGEDNVLRTHVPHFDDKGVRPEPKVFMHSVNKPFTVSEIFNALSITFKGHEEVQSVSNKVGHKVFNLTPESFIDAYPRASLSEWLGVRPAIASSSSEQK